MRHQLTPCLFLMVLVVLAPQALTVNASVPPTLVATWGAPAIDGVFGAGEWNLSTSQLTLVAISGDPSYNYTAETLPLQVAVATDPSQISVAVHLGHFQILVADYAYRLYVALDNGHSQTESKRGYAVYCDLEVGPAGNDTYMMTFSRLPSNVSQWWLSYGVPLAAGRLLEWGVEGSREQEGNYSYEARVPYFVLAWGVSVYGLTRTTTFRLNLVFQIMFLENAQARYVWTYCWPDGGDYRYIYSSHLQGFDESMFANWCLVATQWVEPPPPFTVPPEVFVFLGVCVVTAVVVGVAVWLVRRWQDIRLARRRAVEHWRRRRGPAS